MPVKMFPNLLKKKSEHSKLQLDIIVIIIFFSYILSFIGLKSVRNYYICQFVKIESSSINLTSKEIKQIRVTAVKILTLLSLKIYRIKDPLL